VAAVHKVSHKNVTGLRNLPSAGEELQQIEKLPVDIATDRDRAAHRLYVAFLNQNFLDLPPEMGRG
jgi:hypothetical protein